MKIIYSIILPVLDEEGNLLTLYNNICKIIENLQGATEVLFVDDGSRDGSFNILKSIALKDQRVKLIRFSRNFGQTSAMAAGFVNSRGDIVIPMDADLQNDPRDIPRLLEKLDEGFDVVSGWRVARKEGFGIRVIFSKVANRLISLITGLYIHDYGCTLKAYKREVIEGMQLYGEMHRFIPAYASWNGARVTEIEVTHHPRISGKSKYTLWRTIKVILDLLVVKFLTTYSGRPMHFFGTIGAVSIMLGAASALWALVLKFYSGVSFVETPLPLLTIFLAFLGVQFTLLGLIAEMLTRVYFESQGVSAYRIREKVNL